MALVALVGMVAGCGKAADAAEAEGHGSDDSAGDPKGVPGISFPPIGERPPYNPDDLKPTVAPRGDIGGSGATSAAPSPASTRGSTLALASQGAGTEAAPAHPKAKKQTRPSVAPSGGLSRAVEGVILSAVRGASKKSKGKLKSGQAVVAVMVQDLRSGEVLVNRLGERPLMPASNLKVLTAAAALLGLGPDARFETRFEASGTVANGRLDGTLVVRAGADPMHEREGNGSLDRWLDPLAEDLKKAGIRKVKGPLVLDTSGFEKPGPAAEWPAASAHWQDYCALSGGFNANGGVFRVTVEPRGGRAKVTLRPRHHGLKRRGSVSVKGKKNDLRVGANAGGVTVGGSVPAKMAEFVTEFRHPDPIQLFGESILGGLEARGIQFEERTFVQGTGGAGPMRLLHTMSSPVTSVLDAVLLDSNNAVTDQLFLLVGHRLGGGGTRAKAAAAIRKVLEKAGVDTSELRQADGSGLSKANRLTASCLVQTLSALSRTPMAIRRAFYSSMPLAGSSGSLKNRMKGTAAEGFVIAKTGWVSGASSLSGYVLGSDGRPAIAFSIIVGYPRIGGLNTSSWKPMQDEICALLANEVSARKAGTVR